MAVCERRALLRFGVFVVSIVCGASNASAEPAPHHDPPRPLLVSAACLPPSLMMAEPAVHDRGASLLLHPSRGRPRLLGSLYVGFVALQALDAHSTLTAVSAGRAEANPFIQPFADRPGMLIAAKAATAAGTIALSEKLWRRHRVAAVVLMLAANAGYAAVVAHNYRQVRR